MNNDELLQQIIAAIKQGNETLHNEIREEILESQEVLRAEFRKDIQESQEVLRAEFRKDIQESQEVLRAEFRKDIQESQEVLRTELRESQETLRAEFREGLEALKKELVGQVVEEMNLQSAMLTRMVQKTISDTETRLNFKLEHDIDHQMKALLDGYKLNHDKNKRQDDHLDKLDRRTHQLQVRVAVLEHKMA